MARIRRRGFRSPLWLGTRLDRLPLFRFFADAIQRPISVSELAPQLFPSVEERIAQEATFQLGNLASLSRLENGQPLLPSRIHVVYRGLPPQFVCTNNACDRRRVDSRPYLGHLSAGDAGDCGCGGVRLELLSCRDCRTEYLLGHALPDSIQAFLDGHQPSLNLWSEATRTESGRVHVLPIDPDQPPTHLSGIEAWLDPVRERCTTQWPGRLHVHVGNQSYDSRRGRFTTFQRCCGCNKRVHISNRSNLRIQDLETKGQQPFSNLMAELFQQQGVQDVPEDQRWSRPNRGRKILAFSDSRQKAALLARDLQRDVQSDAFRALILEALQHELSPDGNVPIHHLAAAFMWRAAKRNLRFFDDRARTRYNLIVDRIYGLMSEHGLLDSRLQLVLEHFLDDPASERGSEVESGFLRAFSDPYFSFRHQLLGVLHPSSSFMNHLVTSCGDHPGGEAVVQWATRHVIDHALEHYALFPNTVWYMRDELAEDFTVPAAAPKGYSQQTSILHLHRLLFFHGGLSKICWSSVGGPLNRFRAFARIVIQVLVQHGCWCRSILA